MPDNHLKTTLTPTERNVLRWISMLEAGAKVILRESRCNGLGLSDLCLAEAVYRSMERARQEYENVR